jgi:ABC-type oligopeptide transport system ATPase subunit
VGEATHSGRQAAGAVEAAGLVKTYRSRAGTVDAVRGVDLQVEAGEVFVQVALG